MDNSQMSKEDINMRLKRLWKLLNEEYGIYTKEQLDKAMKETELDIGIFTTKPKQKPV